MVRNETEKIRLKNLPFYNRQILLYIISGVLALIVDYLVFILSYYTLNQSLTVSVPAGLTAGLVVSFLLNKMWTFGVSKKVGIRQTTRQVILYLLLFIINNLFTIYAIDWSTQEGGSAALAKVGTTIVITLWNFVLYKKVIFRQRDDVSSSMI